ncbi:hypothetical protein jhhlp_002636 [Lomentospora prolificans]|uniref:UDP-glucose:glycoprotein glucosyltransferase n=1 Tax=Lomentospora prolificans TaxID=41688 RepID=A0A2N3NEL5_9PEZI|nr:hypothetical protein jhhlp_002636 [Lomentospora prolificans]
MKPRRLPASLGALLLTFASAPALAVPSISVSMRAAFPAGPYLLELIETAAAENSTSYFPLLDRVAGGYFTDAASEKDLYDRFLALLLQDGHISDPDALSTFKLALSMRSAAPRIEAHYHYYSTGVEPNFPSGSTPACDTWAFFDASRYCDYDSLSSLVVNGEPARLPDLPFDRVLGTGPSVVLYTDMQLPSFASFHNSLVEMARRGDISYTVRYRRGERPEEDDSPLPVSGYGVELALKKTDYIMIDDRDATTGRNGDSTVNRDSPDQIVLSEEEEVTDLKPLSKAEVSSLGVNAASLIMKSESPFDTLVKFTEDFPKHSAWIASHNASDEFIKEQRENLGGIVPPGVNVLWMNGVQLIERQIEPFTLVDMLRRERKLIAEAKNIGLTGSQAIALLGHPNVTSAKVDGSSQRFDWRDEREGGGVIMWLNDLESDTQYEEFPSVLTALLQRTYPGQVPRIRRNIFNAVIPIDVAKVDDLKVALQILAFVHRLLPVRFGLVPFSSNAGATDLMKVFYYLHDNYGLEGLFTYIELAAHGEQAAADDAMFEEAINAGSPPAGFKTQKLEEVLASTPLNERIRLTENWVGRLNVNSGTTPVLVNGVIVPRIDNWLQGMGARINLDLQTLRQGLQLGEVNEGTSIQELFLQESVVSRNLRIYADDEEGLNMIDLGKLYREHATLLRNVPVLDAYVDSTLENWATLSVVADLTSEDGLSLLQSALQFKANNPGIRMDIIHNPIAETSMASEINAALVANSGKLLEAGSIQEIRSLLSSHAFAPDTSYGTLLSSYLASTKLRPGSKGLILNGRVVGPLSDNEAFDEDGLQQLVEFERKNRILPVYSAVTDLGLGKVIKDPLAAAKLTSLVALSTISDLPEGIFESAPTLRTSIFNTWRSRHTTIEVGDPESASVHIVGLLNPASEQAQRWTPILKVLSQVDGVYVKLFLNPDERLEELPIKRFYRYVLEAEPTFDEVGKVKPVGATFRGLPLDALLTVGMDVPPAWLVAAKSSVQDPDNIKLSLVKGDVDAVYELRNILIEGHSRMVTQNTAPPSGAQLVLGTEKTPHSADTIIMANLGYFQFKANPGFYNIQLQTGRSSEIFEIESVGALGYGVSPGDEGTSVALMDFKGTTLYPRLKRKPGMETADVLSDGANEAKPSSENLLSRGFKAAAEFLGGSDAKASGGDKGKPLKEHADINIFSVASGHLYERMLNIMMLSVMKHTDHTVKFWFIEQFLSPSFKDSIPHLAREYGFQYEMVAYKWPHWLRQQKEKQREIWGYKILFLDVLFPLSLDKVIFVDADQIVRADMMELVNYNLEGAPYGFTPMCDSRTEMEGFRFWKQGYWANYLRGLPYHISALYVVDLRRFRELAAGDRLRQQYHTLSADPNSLANLDQDLPNHMQFMIPIHSLPQEWLWCETWCSDESLRDAKTIDLCNNPMTKEPKLDRARRQVPEWTVYDEEIAAFERKRKGETTAEDRKEVPSVQEQEQLKEKEEAQSQAAEDDGENEPAVERNTKSRKWEEEPSSRVKDEL